MSDYQIGLVAGSVATLFLIYPAKYFWYAAIDAWNQGKRSIALMNEDPWVFLNDVRLALGDPCDEVAMMTAEERIRSFRELMEVPVDVGARMWRPAEDSERILAMPRKEPMQSPVGPRIPIKDLDS